MEQVSSASASLTEPLDYGSVTLKASKPSRRLEFVNADFGPPITILENTFPKLLSAINEITPLVEENTKLCRDLADGIGQGQSLEAGLKDEVFYSKILDRYSRHNEVRLEGAIYHNKTYVFLKRFYLDKEYNLWRPAKGSVGLSFIDDFKTIRKMLTLPVEHHTIAPTMTTMGTRMTTTFAAAAAAAAAPTTNNSDVSVNNHILDQKNEM